MSVTFSETDLLIFAKKECETCAMVEPVLRELARDGQRIAVLTQDDPTFPASFVPIDDTALEHSFRFDIEAAPTVIRLENGKEVARTFGWDRAEWTRVSGVDGLGAGLPAIRPGCGSKTREPGVYDELVARFGDSGIKSRSITIGAWDDEIEACFDRGWSDGLPVVPPTDARIIRMLSGTGRKPDEVIGMVPPNLLPITVENVAINAVMAGCKPEYMPVVLAALEAALEPEATMHGVLCTTCFSGPILVVNGPIARQIGMNSGINCLGQGNRANATTANCKAVIIALSDCGSCTSCSTHDLSDLDKLGLAGVGVLTEEFRQAFEQQKSAIGLDAAAIYVPHPMQNKTTAELHAFAEQSVDQILASICAAASPNPMSRAA